MTPTIVLVHGGFWHLVANMYALYLFGPRLEEAWGTRRFLRFYAFCAMTGLLANREKDSTNVPRTAIFIAAAEAVNGRRGQNGMIVQIC